MKELAKALLMAAKIRELSWYSSGPFFDKPPYSWHHSGWYKKTIQESMEEATPDKNIQAVGVLLLTACWNDALDWAARFGSKEDPNQKTLF